ncbi:hypothetical protein [Pseudomonas sp. GL-B-16]|uniref:hypothetical protein n=1 Tax=Pseudomonas sp. GL-B-16 TaxID=2832373 RepID=UPI001CBFF1C5|nr:hypothetical protein [Pseudomonas sp. GL-B-16]
MTSPLAVGAQMPGYPQLPLEGTPDPASTRNLAHSTESNRVAFCKIDESEAVQFGRSNTPPADPMKCAAGGNNQLSVTDLLESIVALVLRLLSKLQGAGDEDSGTTEQLPLRQASSARSDAVGGAVSEPAQRLPFQSREVSHVTKQPNAGAETNIPKAIHAKSSVDAIGGASSADPNKPPKDMPPDLWKDCVSACQRQGGDPFVLAAQLKQETQWGSDMGTNGDGVAQVEASTRADNAAKFRESTGHEYDHSSQADQVEMAQMIKVSKGGDETNQLTKYNGGDNWTPGVHDSYGRPIEADSYARKVLAIAADLRRSVS